MHCRQANRSVYLMLPDTSHYKNLFSDTHTADKCELFRLKYLMLDVYLRIKSVRSFPQGKFKISETTKLFFPPFIKIKKLPKFETLNFRKVPPQPF